jgi:hypothetical protein
MLPRRRWLLGRALLRGNLTLKIAPPGVGKSTLGIEQAVAIVTGRPITEQDVHEQTKVWIYNNEDDADELKRRLAAVLQHWDIPLDEVKGRLALNSGADRPLLVAKLDRAGTVIRMPRYGRPKSIRWRVTLRGGLPGHVYADNWPAACERAVRRWKSAARTKRSCASRRRSSRVTR